MGVLRIPGTTYEKAEKILNQIAEDIVYDKVFQDAIAPAGYFRSLKYSQKYLDECIFLPYLNNQKTVNQTYRLRMIQLRWLVAVKYTRDDVIIPLESCHFGYFADATEKSFVKMEDTSGKFIILIFCNLCVDYKLDLIGLKTLNESKRIKFLIADGTHVTPPMSFMTDSILPYLNPDMTD